MKAKRKMKKNVIFGTLAVVVIAGAGGYYVYAQDEQAKLDSKIQEAQQLVLYNELATGEKAKELQKYLNKEGQKVPLKNLRANFKDVNIDSLLNEAKKEIQETEKNELTKQKESLTKISTDLTNAEKDKNFPKEKSEDITKFKDLSGTFEKNQDPVGLNLAVNELKTISGQATTYIAEKTEKQKQQEAQIAAEKKKQEEKAQAEQKQKEADAAQIAAAAESGDYPSLGMYRGDLPNGGGVIAFEIASQGPAYEASLPNASSNWDNGSVIVAIDGKKVDSAILGAESMESVMKQLKLGQRVEIEYKDGTKKTVTLDTTYNQAKQFSYRDFPDAGSSTSTNLYFGVSGYSVGKQHDNKEIGLYITDIYSNSSASSSDLKVGDIICRMGQYWINDTQDIQRVLTHYSSYDSIEVDYIDTNGNLKTTDVTLKTKN
ncbi:PDZ domain-containing protein [uncultured Enterococcus sp.]|uniref:PDZ domain-containing protein n=1 Tax=uncultured Enterococcus sp. TaxID=167972 RepID=UPI0025DD6FA4|nr:PDZ domain-containing protein [uncultured Enterococcus sp.]